MFLHLHTKARKHCTYLLGLIATPKILHSIAMRCTSRMFYPVLQCFTAQLTAIIVFLGIAFLAAASRSSSEQAVNLSVEDLFRLLRESDNRCFFCGELPLIFFTIKQDETELQYRSRVSSYTRACHSQVNCARHDDACETALQAGACKEHARVYACTASQARIYTSERAFSVSCVQKTGPGHSLRAF